MTVRREPVWSWLAQDAMRILFVGLMVGLPLLVAQVPIKGHGGFLQISIRLALALTTQYVTIGLLRELVPKAAVGGHRVAVDSNYTRWLWSSSLAAVALHPLVRLAFWHLQTTRTLYLKALGARMTWSSSTHEDLVIRDPSLVQIGRGTQLEPGVIMEVALHRAGRIRIAPVIIGNGCLIGARSVLLPGATIGHDVRLEPATLIGEDVHVGVGASIGEGVRLERGVDLGSYATVGTGAILSEGVRVGDRAKIAPGSFVEANTTIGEREYWVGTPARRSHFRAPQLDVSSAN